MGIYNHKKHQETEKYKTAIIDKEKDGVIKRKGWRTPYGFIDFKKPVTYEEACAELELIYNDFKKNIDGNEKL